MVKKIENTNRKSTAAARPASASRRPTAKMANATSQPRRIMLAALSPIEVRTSGAAAARRATSSRTTRWKIHAPAATA